MPAQHSSHHHLITIARQARIKLIRFFLALNISEGYFLIVFAYGKLVGVITRGDLMRRYQNELVLYTGKRFYAS